MKNLIPLIVFLYTITLNGNSTNLIEYPGCTDPMALNYDDEASEDNGTCVYSIGPDPIIIDLTISNEECEVFDVGILSSYQYTATLVNIGTEDVTYFCLNDFLGTTYSCFNGVSNLSVWIQPGDTITVSGTIQGAGTWVEGQGNFLSITSVTDEIITANNNYVFYMVTGVDCQIVEPEPCDTIYITETEYVTDTLTLTEYITDTLTLTEYITDTLTITEYLTDYIYLTDTLFEYVSISCDTGLPCDEYPEGNLCWPWTVYIPNTFTPNNDGFNDVWQIVYDLECWVDVEFRIFNRWGNQIFNGYGDSFNSYPYWDGSVNDGSYYVSDGIYTFTFYARKVGSTEIYQKNGYITIFR